MYQMNERLTARCVGSFVPVTLEQLARERGVLRSDRSTPCVAKTTSIDGTGKLLLRAAAARAEGSNQCVVRLFGTEINTASFPLYTFSIAVLVQAVTLVTFSSFADHGKPMYRDASRRRKLTWLGNYRKRLLLTFGFTGAISSMLFLLVDPSIYVLGSVLTIISVACLGSSFVILNSFLPLLVANHPTVQSVQSVQEDDIDRDTSIPLQTMLSDDAEIYLSNPQSLQKRKTDSPELQLSTKISSNGVGIGYAAAVFVQILSIVLLFVMSKTSTSSNFNLRLILFLVGLWWFTFTIPSYLYLRSRPGPPLKTAPSSHGRLRTYIAHATLAWSNLWCTIKVAIHLRQVLIFLAAWFLLSDAVATVSGTAILFARTELGMGTVAIALLSITSTSSGIAGALLWPIIARRYALRTSRVIMACVLLMEVIPLYGLLGFVPFIQNWGVGGLQQAWEIFPLAVVHGFVMGGLSSFCRSFYGLLIPPGQEAAFYALYAVTDKGSSAIGPAAVGIIVDRYGAIRPAFVFLAVLIALPVPLIWIVDAEKGKEDARRMVDVMRKVEDEDVNLDRPDDGLEEREGLMRDHD